METKAWMAMNWLKLNDEKTLSLLLRARDLSPTSAILLLTTDNNIPQSPSARNLGVTFD